MSAIPDAPELLIPPARHGQPRKDGKPSEFKSDGLRACQAEWKLLCGTHNLLKLWRTTTAATS